MKLKVEVDLGNKTMDNYLRMSIYRMLKGIAHDIKSGFKSGNVTNDRGDRIGRFTLEEGVLDKV